MCVPCFQHWSEYPQRKTYCPHCQTDKAFTYKYHRNNIWMDYVENRIKLARTRKIDCCIFNSVVICAVYDIYFQLYKMKLITNDIMIIRQYITFDDYIGLQTLLRIFILVVCIQVGYIHSFVYNHLFRRFILKGLVVCVSCAFMFVVCILTYIEYNKPISNCLINSD